jgi:peroxiredoxin
MVEASTTPTIQDGPSKKQIERESKKLKNKTKQAITVLCKSEDLPFEKLVILGDEATGRMFVTHFGNGDEAD